MAGSGKDLPYATLSRHIDALLNADERLIAAFWDDAQPPSANYENIAYWLGQSAGETGPEHEAC